MAQPASFMVPAGRRLSRVDSKTLRESFTGQDNAEMEAVMRNLARKDDKIKYNRRMRVVLAGAIGVMVIMVGAMFAVTLSANEATKESHVSRSNAMVGLDGKAITTAKDTAYVKLAELSRASTQYLSNLEDVTLASQGKVHQFKVTGFTLHDSDNLDLSTSTATVIKIQCGVIRINFADGKVVDADEMHKEATGAARQLRAMSAAELEAHYEAHASAATRKLAESNPLKSLYAFFGGMAKSSANSELYGALAPTTGCKKPPALITIMRPTIPEHSKWTVSVQRSTGMSKKPDTWYMSWDQTSKLPKMRFESPDEDCRKHVTVSTAAQTSDYFLRDQTLCSTKVDDTSHLTCPEAKDLNGKTCDQFKSDWVKTNTEMTNAMDNEITSCKVSPGIEADMKLSVKVLDAFADGSSVWEVGFYIMKVDSTGTPTGIKPNDRDDTEAKFYKVLKVEAFKPEEKLFQECDATVEGDSSTNAPGHDGKRRLSTWTAFQAWASGTQWCGAGTDLINTECPKTSSDNGDMACHRHDHGRKANGIIGGVAVRLGCDIDRGLADRTSNWAAQVIFGSWGLAQTWGCYDHGTYNCWNWKSKWWGGYWRYGGYCSGEHTHYGPSRYSSYSHSYGWNAQSRCTNNLGWATGDI